MKKFIIVLIVVLLSTGIYVSAQSYSNPTYNVVDDETNFYQREIAPRFHHYYMTSENHDLILEKRVELTKTYLSDYDNMTTEEKQQAEENYTNDLQAYIEELTGDTMDPALFEGRFGDRMLDRFDEATHEAIVSKRVELTLKYFDNYASLTDAEKEQAMIDYQNEFRTFMDDIRPEYFEDCPGYGGRGQYGGHGMMGRGYRYNQ